MLYGKTKDITFVFLGLLTVLLNSVETGLILRIKNKKIFDRLLLSLALSDVLVGVTVSTVKSADLYHGSNFSWLKQEDIAAIFLLSIVFSFSNLLAIAIDRFLAVQYPIKHRILLTPRRANIAIAALWLLCLISVLMNSLSTYKWTINVIYLLYGASVTILVFGVLITIIYCTIFYLICKRKMHVARTDGAQDNAIRGGFAAFLKGPYKFERAVLFTGCIVAISFIICTYPFAIEFLIGQSVEHISYMSKAVMILNSLLNPLIYFFKSYCGTSDNR